MKTRYIVWALMSQTDSYHQISNISRTLVSNKIVDHSDVVGASPVGAAPTTSSFSTWHLASINWVKKTESWGERHLNFVIWCTYIRDFMVYFLTITHCVHLAMVQSQLPMGVILSMLNKDPNQLLSLWANDAHMALWAVVKIFRSLIQYKDVILPV